MRIQHIHALKEKLCSQIQPLPEGDFSDQLPSNFRLLQGDTMARSVKRIAAVAAGTTLTHLHRRNLDLGTLKPDQVTMGERFAENLSLARLKSLLKSHSKNSVLIPGCYMGGEDVQFWLRSGVSHLVGIDVYPLHKNWETIVPELRRAYHADVDFRHASIEQIPLEDESFDVIASAAVLEHVRNLRAMASETARILRPGGLAWHSFGPLYYSYGADHCIASYGLDHGYDHLLLNESQYQAKINDQAFYDTQADPNQPFWARHNQFSFATIEEYLAVFARHFDVQHVVIKISDQAILFRDRFPESWKALRNAGISENALLIKSAVLILKKR